jgi:hypothetical protein
MSDENYEGIEKNMLPIFNSLVTSIFDGDFKSFLKHHPPVPEAQFDEAVSNLKPLGKPIKLEYLCHLVKLDRTKVLCKATYSETPEELVWDFNLIPDGDNFRLENMGFDK